MGKILAQSGSSLNSIYLMGWIGFHKSCEITGKIKNITITSRGRKWFASIQVEQMVEIRKHSSDSEIGIDAGIRCFATFSDGTMIEGVNSFRKHEERLAREQRKLSKLHHTIANVRSDFLHKQSTDISKNHAKVFVEKLQIKNMSASAKGSIEEPGRSVKAKSGLNKSILDQGWFELRRQLDYKLFWRGGMLSEVNPRHTSQRCSSCGHVAKENRLSQEVFRCQGCGYEENADENRSAA